MTFIIQQPQIFVQEGFAAGKGNTAAGFQIKDIILLQLASLPHQSSALRPLLVGIWPWANRKALAAIHAVPGNEIDYTLIISGIGFPAYKTVTQFPQPVHLWGKNIT